MALTFRGGQSRNVNDPARETARATIMSMRPTIEKAILQVNAIRSLRPEVKNRIIERLRNWDTVYIAQTIEEGQEL